MTEVILSARAVEKSFGRTQALRGVSLELARGEVLAVTGPSGGGKSTLLHCLSGILRPEAGKVRHGIALLDAWLRWASRSQLPSFVKLARSIRKHRVGVDAALLHGLSNARVESVNTKLRLLTRIAFGFRSPEALVALAMLDLGGMCPPLPGRAAA